MDQTNNVTPAQSAPSTPSTTQASKTQAKSGLEPANEADFKKELLAKIHEAQGTPAMLLVPKMAMQGSTDAKLRVATRLLLQKVEWLDEDGTTKCEAELCEARGVSAALLRGVPCSSSSVAVDRCCGLTGAAAGVVAATSREARPEALPLGGSIVVKYAAREGPQHPRGCVRRGDQRVLEKRCRSGEGSSPAGRPHERGRPNQGRTAQQADKQGKQGSCDAPPSRSVSQSQFACAPVL